MNMQSDEQEIRQLVDTWMAASKTGDVETVLSLMAEDVVFLQPGQPPMRKVDFAAAARAQPGQEAPRIEGTSEVQEIKVLGEWAFMWTKLTVTVTPPGGSQSITRAGHTLSISRKKKASGSGAGREFVVSGVKGGGMTRNPPSSAVSFGRRRRSDRASENRHWQLRNESPPLLTLAYR